MYIYYDKQGILREVITDSIVRNGDNLTDSIYICFEDDQETVTTYNSIIITFGTTNVTKYATRETSRSIVPDGDYKFFKPYKKYWFWKYSIVSDDYVVGLNYAVVKYLLDPVTPTTVPTKTQGVITFNVEDDHIISDPTITQSQFLYLLSYLSMEGRESIVLINELSEIEEGVEGKVYCIRSTGVLYRWVDGGWEVLSYEKDVIEINTHKVQNLNTSSSTNYPSVNAVKNALQNKADLGNDGKVVASQLPSYIDEITNISTLTLVADSVYDLPEPSVSINGTQLLCLNANQIDPLSLQMASADDWAKGFIAKCYDASGTPTTWEYLTTLGAGNIYITVDTNKTYRYTTATQNHLVEISASLALGETADTAYAGNKGKANADNIEEIKQDYVKKVDTSSTPSANKIAKYSSAGRLQSEVPVNDDDVANKEYVDGLNYTTMGVGSNLVVNINGQQYQGVMFSDPVSTAQGTYRTLLYSNTGNPIYARDEVSHYLEFMTGNPILPEYDAEKPYLCIFITTSTPNVVYKMQYASSTGLRAYIVSNFPITTRSEALIATAPQSFSASQKAQLWANLGLENLDEEDF